MVDKCLTPRPSFGKPMILEVPFPNYMSDCDLPNVWKDEPSMGEHCAGEEDEKEKYWTCHHDP